MLDFTGGNADQYGAVFGEASGSVVVQPAAAITPMPVMKSRRFISTSSGFLFREAEFRGAFNEERAETV